MTTTTVNTRVDILNLALNEAIIEKDSIEQEIQKIKNKESSFGGVYGAFQQEQDQLKHSRFYYTNELDKVNTTINEIQRWKEELREETLTEKVG